MFRLLLKTSTKIKRVKKNYMEYEKLMNLLEIKKDRLPDYLLDHIFHQFVNKFSELLLLLW